MHSSFVTPRNITFAFGTKKYIDYFGHAMNIFDYKNATCLIYAEDPDIVREIAYLSILSNVSALLEKKGLHRIHALGIAYKNAGILLMMPSGGGKSTISLTILNDPSSEIKLISEDSPLMQKNGFLLPFPLRIGIDPRTPIPEVNQEFIRYTKRMGFPAKLTIDIRQFSSRICTHEVKPRVILLGIRSTGNDAAIIATNRLASVKHCLMNSVIGVGLYQGMEFIMQEGLFSLLKKSGTIISRMESNACLIARSKFYYFIAGPDAAHNHRILQSFLQEHCT
ncbi:MAG TPA: hypothetical protein PKL77_00265 [Candidatus Omnitrophota bacterium]|nr:hypothetical protein [Candidatus Omnitrophota bacterium]HPT06645.1 hypothetical protein [Candidatus Omnitrophota bacterium]